MNTSAAVRAVITNAGIKQGDLAGPLDLSSVQAVSNKFRLNRWTAQDLATVADLTGCKLAFIYPDGEQVIISAAGPELVQAAPVGNMAEAMPGRVTPVSTDEK